MYLEMDVLYSRVVNLSLSILCMFYLICAYCLDIFSFFIISRSLLVCHMNSSLTFINLIFIDFVVLTAQAGQHLGIASVSSIWYSYWLNWNYSDTVTLWPVICIVLIQLLTYVLSIIETVLTVTGLHVIGTVLV